MYRGDSAAGRGRRSLTPPPLPPPVEALWLLLPPHWLPGRRAHGGGMSGDAAVEAKAGAEMAPPPADSGGRFGLASPPLLLHAAPAGAGA